MTQPSNSIVQKEEIAHTNQDWLGCSMAEIIGECDVYDWQHEAPIEASDKHTVLFKLPIEQSAAEPPTPLSVTQAWNELYVQLPCLLETQPHWSLVEHALSKPINNSQQLQSAILSYNSKYADSWNFKSLHRLFAEELNKAQVNDFFSNLLPRIIKLALNLPQLVQAPIPLLQQNMNHSISITQQQISCLLANAFLCTFPKRNNRGKGELYNNYPRINFSRLYQFTGQKVLQKLKCLLNYFRRVCAQAPTGVVTFTRFYLEERKLPNWSSLKTPLNNVRLHITSAGGIEDAAGLLQVDFANRFLGGGVLGAGCVQEEIRFVIYPELFAAKLFTECLAVNEAVLIVGCERYNNYTGYASSFQWTGDYVDKTPRDSSRRCKTQLVAIDAKKFWQSAEQYEEQYLLRELNKAYVGFQHRLSTPTSPVATGNWGCGAYRGDISLKVLLQLMACAVTERAMVYYTFGNVEKRNEIYQMFQYLLKRQVQVGQLYVILKEFKAQNREAEELYQYICECLENVNMANLSL